jgi:HlyD family secretion protein
VINVSIGDTTLIEIDAIPDTTYKGIVSEIAHSATTRGLGTQEQVTNFEIEVSVIGQDARFRPGMSATVDIITDIRDSAIVVPIQSLTVRQPVQADSADKSSATEMPQETVNAFNLKSKALDVVFVVNAAKNEQPRNGSQSLLSFKKLFKKKTYPSAEQRVVKVGISSDTQFEITSGLDVDEEIVTGSYKAISKELKHGSPLKITNNNKEKEKEK